MYKAPSPSPSRSHLRSIPTPPHLHLHLHRHLHTQPIPSSLLFFCPSQLSQFLCRASGQHLVMINTTKTICLLLEQTVGPHPCPHPHPHHHPHPCPRSFTNDCHYSRGPCLWRTRFIGRRCRLGTQAYELSSSLSPLSTRCAIIQTYADKTCRLQPVA